MTLSDELRKLADDPKLLWGVARRAIEDELVDYRDAGLSLLGRSNGLVIRHSDGTDSHIIRMGPESAVRTGLLAIADYFEAGKAEETAGNGVRVRVYPGDQRIPNEINSFDPDIWSEESLAEIAGARPENIYFFG